jgi:hypothetical protein
MNPTAFSQYRSKRDYRAVVFTGGGLENLQQVVALFNGRSLSKREEAGLPPLQDKNVNGIRVVYQSKNCFVRGGGEERKTALLTGKGTFEYEVCVLSYKKSGPPLFLVAVPFSGMAREFFGKIHSGRATSDFRYLRPSLEGLVSALSATQNRLERIRTVGINWSVAGDIGRSDQITIRGADVIHSSAYKLLIKPESQLTLSLRKLQIIHEGFGGQAKLKLTFDKFGNHGVWVTQEGANLPDIFKIYELLKKRELVTDESAFPVRNREDEPLMP